MLESVMIVERDEAAVKICKMLAGDDADDAARL